MELFIASVSLSVSEESQWGEPGEKQSARPCSLRTVVINLREIRALEVLTKPSCLNIVVVAK